MRENRGQRVVPTGLGRLAPRRAPPAAQPERGTERERAQERGQSGERDDPADGLRPRIVAEEKDPGHARRHRHDRQRGDAAEQHAPDQTDQAVERGQSHGRAVVRLDRAGPFRARARGGRVLSAGPRCIARSYTSCRIPGADNFEPLGGGAGQGEGDGRAVVSFQLVREARNF